MTASPIECRLRHAPYAEGHPYHPRPALTRGEVELVNTSAGAVVIEYDRHPLQHIDLLVTDAAGRVRSAGYYGGIFSAFGGVEELRLNPGEAYRTTVGLLATVPRPCEAGRYIIRAVFEYDGWRAVSGPVEIEAPA